MAVYAKTIKQIQQFLARAHSRQNHYEKKKYRKKREKREKKAKRGKRGNPRLKRLIHQHSRQGRLEDGHEAGRMEEIPSTFSSS